MVESSSTVRVGCVGLIACDYLSVAVGKVTGRASVGATGKAVTGCVAVYSGRPKGVTAYFCGDGISLEMAVQKALTTTTTGSWNLCDRIDEPGGYSIRPITPSSLVIVSKVISLPCLIKMFRKINAFGMQFKKSM